MKKIAALGGNPAFQKTLFFRRFDPGKVNRAEEMQLFASGKGVNFCRAVRCLDCGVTGELIQFAGGENGRFICRELDREGITHRTTETSRNTRCCTTCLDRGIGGMTEIIEPSFTVSDEEGAHLLADFRAALEGASAAAITGTLPGKTDTVLYVEAARAAGEKRLPLLLDAYRDIDRIWDSGAEIWLKINRDELAALTGMSGVHQGLRWLYGRFPLRYAAITDGPASSYATDGVRITQYTLPVLDEVVNPIGCGDTASGVWLAEMVRGIALEEAFCTALAAASANCLTALPGSFDLGAMQKLREGIRFTTDLLG